MANGLPGTGFLSGASAQLKQVLESQATELSLDRGQVLFEHGDDGDALFAVVAGAVDITILSVDGRRLALDVMRPGAIFGEIALFDPGPRTATATAAEPTRLLRIRYADVMAQVRRNPDLAVDLIQLAGERMRWMNRQLKEQVFLPLPARLARKVLYLTRDTGDAPAALGLSQAELAEFVGATREAVSKTLSAWRKAGVIRATRGGLEVLDRAALRSLAEPDTI
ncbi:Crp/Fnr family transcriptional regulator [Pukyongiella litopenaei]